MTTGGTTPGPADKTKGETKGKTKVRLRRQVRATPPDPARSRLSPRAAASPAASRALRSSRPFRDGRGDLSPTQPPSRFPDRPGSHLPLDHRPSPQTMPASTVRATSIYGASLSRTMRSPARPKRAAPRGTIPSRALRRGPPRIPPRDPHRNLAARPASPRPPPWRARVRSLPRTRPRGRPGPNLR